MNNILMCCGYKEQDVNIVKGHGEYLYDDNGRRYVDFEAGVWSAALGHSHPLINEAITKQIEQIMHLGYQYKNPIVEEAGAGLLSTVKIPEGKCVFLCSGSEAVEFGVQSIKRIIQRPLLLSLVGSYLAAYGSAGRRSPEEWYFFDWGKCSNCALEECSQDCQYFKDIPFEKIGGLVFEPGNTSGMVKLPPKKLVKALEIKVRQLDGLIMANEITTGFGRTGKWFGYEHYELQPDIVAVGKSMGNGYPVSAVAMSADVAGKLESGGLRYAQSHQNDAMGCAIAIEVMKVMKNQNLVSRSAEIGNMFKSRLEKLASRYDCIKEVRGRGLMLAVEFKTGMRLSLSEIHQGLYGEGFITGYNISGNLLRFYPALIIRESSIEDMLNCFECILE